MAVHALAFFTSEDILLQKSWELPGLGLLPSTSRSGCVHPAPLQPTCLQRCGSRAAPAQPFRPQLTHGDPPSRVPISANRSLLSNEQALLLCNCWEMKTACSCSLVGVFFPSLFFYYCMVTTIKSFLAWHFIWELFPHMTVLYPCVNYLMFHYTNRLHLQKRFPAGKNQMLELQVFCRGEPVLRQWDRGSRPVHSCWAGAVMPREGFIFKKLFKEKDFWV